MNMLFLTETPLCIALAQRLNDLIMPVAELGSLQTVVLPAHASRAIQGQWDFMVIDLGSKDVHLTRPGATEGAESARFAAIEMVHRELSAARDPAIHPSKIVFLCHTAHKKDKAAMTESLTKHIERHFSPPYHTELVVHVGAEPTSSRHLTRLSSQLAALVCVSVINEAPAPAVTAPTESTVQKDPIPQPTCLISNVCVAQSFDPIYPVLSEVLHALPGKVRLICGAQQILEEPQLGFTPTSADLMLVNLDYGMKHDNTQEQQIAMMLENFKFSYRLVAKHPQIKLADMQFVLYSAMLDSGLSNPLNAVVTYYQEAINSMTREFTTLPVPPPVFLSRTRTAPSPVQCLVELIQTRRSLLPEMETMTQEPSSFPALNNGNLAQVSVQSLRTPSLTIPMPPQLATAALVQTLDNLTPNVLEVRFDTRFRLMVCKVPDTSKPGRGKQSLQRFEYGHVPLPSLPLINDARVYNWIDALHDFVLQRQPFELLSDSFERQFLHHLTTSPTASQRSLLSAASFDTVAPLFAYPSPRPLWDAPTAFGTPTHWTPKVNTGGEPMSFLNDSLSLNPPGHVGTYPPVPNRGGPPRWATGFQADAPTQHDFKQVRQWHQLVTQHVLLVKQWLVKIVQLSCAAEDEKKSLTAALSSHTGTASFEVHVPFTVQALMGEDFATAKREGQLLGVRVEASSEQTKLGEVEVKFVFQMD